MRILCVSKLVIPYIDGTTVCITKFLRALMAAGHDVRLITAKDLPTRPRMPGPGWESVGCPTRYVEVQARSRPRLWKWVSRIASTLNPCCIPFHQDAEWVYATERVLIDEIDSYRPDVVLTMDPRGGHLAGLRARRNRNFLWIVSLDDPWDRRTMFGRIPWYSLSHLYHRRVISLIASKADAFVFPSKRLETYEKQFSFGPWPSLVEIIPHIGYVAEEPAPRAPHRFRLVHVGDLRPPGRAECLLPEGLQKSAVAEPSLREQVELVLVGDVPEWFLRRVETCVGSIFRWVPPCSYPTSLEYIVSADVNVMIESRYAAGILMLAKLADYALVDAPILALGPKVGNMADLADEGQCLHAPSDDADAIAQKVLELYRAWRAGDLCSYRHEALKQMCQPENAARSFEALVHSLTGTSAARADENVNVRLADEAREVGGLSTRANVD